MSHHHRHELTKGETEVLQATTERLATGLWFAASGRRVQSVSEIPEGEPSYLNYAAHLLLQNSDLDFLFSDTGKAALRRVRSHPELDPRAVFDLLTSRTHRL